MLKSLPLHFQILIALVVGTVIGATINPGETSLDGQIQATVSPGDGTEFVVRETAGDGHAVFEQRFGSYGVLTNRYPGEWNRDGESAAPIDDAKVHIVDDGRKTTLRYTRKIAGVPVITTLDDSGDEPFHTDEFWGPVVAEHGGGIGRAIAVWAKRIGDLFLRLLKMVTVPLIVTSLVTGVAGLGQSSRFGAMFGKTLAYYAATSLLAITTGIAIVNLVKPGVGATLPGGGHQITQEEHSLGDIFLGMSEKMIPTNPVESLANSQFLSIIVFSILIGVFIIKVGGQAGETLRSFFEAGFQVMMRMTMAVIALAPIGVCAFMLYATSTQGLGIFMTLGWYMLAVFLALVVHACVVLPIILKFVAKRSPVEFARAMSPALMTAFSTASSNATLPLTMTSVEQRAGVSNRVSSFVLPLGATINMDGTALYEAVAVLFIAQATPGFDMTLGAQVTVAITALLASVGAAGIPHAGLVMMAIVLQAVGLPLEAQGIIIAVDRVLDMCRTSVNVWSDSCGCAVLNRLEPDVASAGSGEPAAL